MTVAELRDFIKELDDDFLIIIKYTIINSKFYHRLYYYLEANNGITSVSSLQRWLDDKLAENKISLLDTITSSGDRVVRLLRDQSGVFYFI